MITLNFMSQGDRWVVVTESPMVREFLADNPPARSFTVDGALYIAPEQADELAETLRAVGLLDARPEWCALVEGIEE